MNADALKIDCQEMLALADEASAEMEIIIEMLIEADEEVCEDLAA